MGYPALSKAVIAWAKENKVQIILSPLELKKRASDDSKKIVILGFGLLVSMGVPILGYKEGRYGMWSPSKLKWRDSEGIYVDYLLGKGMIYCWPPVASTG